MASLEGEGLLCRQTDPGDSRARLAALTATGLRLYRDAERQAVGDLRGVWDDFTHDEWHRFIDFLSLPHALSAALMAMAIRLWQHESHAHRHVHAPITHRHPHRHDDGPHDHTHTPPVAPDTWHTHEHSHPQLAHNHEHRPDLHHRHEHGRRARRDSGDPPGSR